nr:uncharacterized protein LOC101480301 [Maylandia zebra]
MNGTAGNPLTLQCPYPPQHWDNRKFLCKGDHRNKCTDMVTSRSRFTLQDDAASSSFTVRITELKVADTGIYWCGSDSLWGVGNYIKIEQSVFLQHTRKIPDAALYVVYTVPPVLLLMCLLVTIYKNRCSRVNEADDTMSRNTPKGKNIEEVMGAAESGIYKNQEVVMTYVQQKVCKDGGGEEGVYEIMTANATEDIYCNENFHKANRR